MSKTERPPLPTTPWCGLVHESAPYDPEWTSNQDGYTEEDMRNYAEAAVAAERARWIAAIAAAMPKHELFDDQRAAANTCRAILRDCEA